MVLLANFNGSVSYVFGCHLFQFILVQRVSLISLNWNREGWVHFISWRFGHSFSFAQTSKVATVQRSNSDHIFQFFAELLKVGLLVLGTTVVLLVKLNNRDTLGSILGDLRLEVFAAVNRDWSLSWIIQVSIRVL